MISALTLTNGRPECLELCKHYVARQTVPVDEHVISEGKDFWGNLKDGLSLIKGEIVIVFEDDDWYSPEWVKVCVEGLKRCRLFGQNRLNYFHVPTGGWFSKSHGEAAPFHATAWKGLTEEIQKLPPINKGHKPLLDTYLWGAVSDKQVIDGRYVVSMKGMPGTPGYGQAHSKDFYEATDRGVLKKWIGEDAALYERFMK